MQVDCSAWITSFCSAANPQERVVDGLTRLEKHAPRWEGWTGEGRNGGTEEGLVASERLLREIAGHQNAGEG